MSIGGPHEVLPPHGSGHRAIDRRPPGALAEHRSGCMITASEVSKKPGAVHCPRRRQPSDGRPRGQLNARMTFSGSTPSPRGASPT